MVHFLLSLLLIPIMGEKSMLSQSVKWLIGILTFLLCFQAGIAQNLIPDSDFEDFIQFDNYDFGHKILENNPTTWHNPTRARPEIYFDLKTAKSGSIFAGVNMIGIRGYREYISTPITCRLIAGETYVLQFYVKLSDNSEFAVSSFGALFSNDKISSQYSSRLKEEPQIFVDNTSFYADKKAWTIVRDSFVATGNESYVTIGNFLDDDETVTKKIALMAQEGKAYYYIDDVTLFPAGDKDPCRILVDSSKCESITISDLNIAPDPSFECFVKCPSSINTEKLDQLKYWTQTSSGTPDYFNSCSIIMSAPKNIMGEEKPHTGEGYVGLYLFDEGNYREYITSHLAQPMSKKQWYVITMWVALSDNSNIATDAFEFMVTEKQPNILLSDDEKWEEANGADTAKARKIIAEIIAEDGNVLSKLRPQVINTPGNFADQRTWQKICGVYLAEGGEQYITMGNFKTDEQTGKRKVGTGNNAYAYYFIDDFTVEPLTASNMSECGAGISIADVPKINTSDLRYYDDLTIPQLLSGKPFTFKGFYFEFDKYNIIDSNYAFLDSLVEMMYDDDRLTITVHGHTDYVGNKRYNSKLSKNRAKAVVEYLIAEGVEKERVSYEYFGATQPVASNLTPEGRQKNRRVEFILKRE